MRALNQQDFERLHSFRYAIRRFLRFSEEAARAAGLHPQHHQLLLTVQSAGPETGVSVALIAERLQLRHHTAVGLIDRAEERGLVTRERSADDHRVVLVRTTEAGRTVLRQLSEAHLLELQTAGAELVRILGDIVAAPPPPSGPALGGSTRDPSQPDEPSPSRARQ